MYVFMMYSALLILKVWDPELNIILVSGPVKAITPMMKSVFSILLPYYIRLIAKSINYSEYSLRKVNLKIWFIILL
jgi:hypothetical protein